MATTRPAGERVEVHLERLPDGRSELELDHRLVRDDQVLQGHRVEGFWAHATGTLEIDSLDQKVLVRGQFTARREMVCHRSGEAFELEYPVEVEVLVYRTPHRASGTDFDAEDNWVIHQPSGMVDLSEALLEAIVLDEPQRVVHPDYAADEASVDGEEETEDEGDPIDPRWEALRKLREGDTDSAEGSSND